MSDDMDDASFESFGDFGDFQSASTVFDDDGTFGGSTELTPTGTDSSWTFAGQERHPNSDTIMFIISSAQSILSLVLLENALLSPTLDNLRDNVPREFRMALDGDKAAWRIHTLHSTARG